MGQSRTLPPRMQNMYQRANSWNGAQQWQRPSSSSAIPAERPQHHHHRGERSERGERERGAGGAPTVHVLPPRMRAVKAPRHQSANTALDASFGLVAPPSPPSPSDPLGLGRNLDQLNAARPSVSRSYEASAGATNNYNYNTNYSTAPSHVVYTTSGMMMMDNTRTSQLSPEAPIFQPRFGMPASAPLYSTSTDEFPFPPYMNSNGGGGGGGSSGSGASYYGGDANMVGNIGDSSSALGVSFSLPSPTTSPTRASPTSSLPGSPPKITKLPPIAPPPMTKPDDNTPPPPAYLVNFLASKFGPTTTMMATTSSVPTPVVANVNAFVAAPVQVSTPVVEEPSLVLYDSALSSSSVAAVPAPAMTIALPVPPPTAKMVPSSSSTMSLVPTVPILKLPTPPNKRSAPSSPTPTTPRPAPSPPVARTTTTKMIGTGLSVPKRPSAPSRSSYIVADMLLNRIRSSPLRPGLGPRRATSPAMSGNGSTSPVSRSCLSKEVLMEDVVLLSLPVSS